MTEDRTLIEERIRDSLEGLMPEADPERDRLLSAAREHPFDAPIEIRATGMVGMRGEIGLSEVIVTINGKPATVALSALPRFSRAVEEFCEGVHRFEGNEHWVMQAQAKELRRRFGGNGD